MGCADDDVGNGWGNADLNAGVTFLGELALEEFVQLGVEDTVYEKVMSVILSRVLCLLNAACCHFPFICFSYELPSHAVPMYPPSLSLPNLCTVVGEVIPATNFLRLELL